MDKILGILSKVILSFFFGLLLLFCSCKKDKTILQEYDNIENDIMSISLNNNIKPFEVVSLLIRYKIISKSHIGDSNN